MSRARKSFFGIFNQLAALSLLLILFAVQVLKSSAEVLWWIYTKADQLESEFFELKLTVEEDFQHILIAHFITLTPGTISVEIDHRRRAILIHLLAESEKQGTIDLINNQVEPLVKKLWGQT